MEPAAPVETHPDSDRGSLPLLTEDVVESLRHAVQRGITHVECSLDLQRSQMRVDIDADHWCWRGARYPYLESCKPRTIYFWDGAAFQVAARFTQSLTKLVPTQWGAPTFEIDGIKMLPTATVSPFEDARRKVDLIQPRDKTILDTCGGLGYFAEWCLRGQARRVVSYEKSTDVLWLRSLNPWSPKSAAGRPNYELHNGDVLTAIQAIGNESCEAVLHDPPRFGIAGELYSQHFYDELARVLKRKGRLFHYTGTPNKLSRGRDLPQEVATRLQRAGFRTRMEGDGVFAVKDR